MNSKLANVGVSPCNIIYYNFINNSCCLGENFALAIPLHCGKSFVNLKENARYMDPIL